MAFAGHSTTKRLQIHNELANPTLARLAAAVVRRVPLASVAPVRLVPAPGLRDRHGPVHAGSFLRERRIAFDCTPEEFPRILVHELFHFAWLRLGNHRRRAWEELLQGERHRGVRGELGWSAEWRKASLREEDVAGRTRAWRLYCCESFCDTAAWLYSGRAEHPEFTLAGNPRLARRRWFIATIETCGLSI